MIRLSHVGSKLSAEQIFELFINRKDVYSVQQPSGAYFIQKHPLTIDLIKKHLKGEITLGTYALTPDNKVKWACVDIDTDEHEVWKVYPEALIIYNCFIDFPRMLEDSGRRGYHIWIFFSPRVSAEFAQLVVKARINRPDLNKHEVFPKQTTLSETRKYGNLVKIPFGKHLKSGRFSKILKIDGFENDN